MKLYSSNLSPYGQRVKIAIRAKGLEDTITVVDQRPQTEDYKRLNPTGKIPALEVDGVCIPESEVILEFIEDRFPDNPLRPADPVLRAKARLVSRLCDLYVAQGLFPLFRQMSPKVRDQAKVDEGFAQMDHALGLLETYLTDGEFAVSDTLSTADCAAAPILFFIPNLAPAFGRVPFEGRPKAQGYYHRIGNHPVVGVAMAEMAEALKNFSRG